MSKATKKAAKAAKAAAKASGAEPGSQATDVVVKKKKSKRTVFVHTEPLEVAVPEKFDFAKNKPLKKTDFKNEDLFFEYKAAECDAKAIVFRAKAEESKKLGSTKDRAKAKRLLKMQEKMAELREQLEADGVNVEELLA